MSKRFSISFFIFLIFFDSVSPGNADDPHAKKREVLDSLHSATEMKIESTKSGYRFFVYPGEGGCQKKSRVEIICINNLDKALSEMTELAKEWKAVQSCLEPVAYLACPKSDKPPFEIITHKGQTICESSLDPALKPAVSLKHLSLKTELASPDSNDYFNEDYSSSFLIRTDLPNPKNFALKAYWDRQLAKWCNTFSSQKIYDRDSTTAWCEGAPADGLGESVFADIDLKSGQKVEIWSGYGKSNATFYANNRPRKIKVSVVAELFFGGFTPDLYRLIPLAEKTIELKDVNQFQAIPSNSNPLFFGSREENLETSGANQI